MAAEALVPVLLEKLASILTEQATANVKLVVGVEEDIEMLSSNFMAIQARLADAENRQVKEIAVGAWLDKLKNTSYDIEDVLDRWITAIRKFHMEEAGNGSNPMSKVCSFVPTYCFSPSQIALRHHIATKIKFLNKVLDNIAKEKHMFEVSLMSGTEEPRREIATSVIDLSNVHGRDQEKDTVVNLLVSESSQSPVSVPVISIVGMGGIGKTTLARLAFQDERVKNHFDKKIWVSVSDPFDEVRIAKAILESLQGHAPDQKELETLLQLISAIIERKKYLLVLDDVWTQYPKWEQLKDSLKCGSKQSRILLTTRNQNVADIMGTTGTNMISLRELPGEECWSLFTQLAFPRRTVEECGELTCIGRKIVAKCNGLPLAVKILGSFLSSKKNIKDWERVLGSEFWELKEVETGLFPYLFLSYQDLPPIVKKCFAYCAIFPKEYRIEKEKLIRLWMAQGFLEVDGSEDMEEDMESVGEEYFEFLARRSFFQDFERREDDGSVISCEMHDVVHDFAQSLTKNECLQIDDLKKSEKAFSYKGARHCLIRCGSIPVSIFNEKKIRSLVIDSASCSLTDDSLSKLFSKLKCLRAIEFAGSCGQVKKIPRGIKELIHFRYINLSNFCEIRELPEEICDLYNLEILDLTECSGLEELPQGMGKLINLKYLINERTMGLRSMPKGMERLTSLRKLSEFVVSDGRHGKQAATLGCLKNVNHLQGSLLIRNLGFATDVDDAKQAELANKEGLVSLILKFDKKDEKRMVNKNDEEVLEALQLPPRLKKLNIEIYEGKTLPSWIESFSYLKELKLYRNRKCERLPSLGKLQNLESLIIDGLWSIRKVGNEFLGIAINASSSTSSAIAFPKLKTLQFSSMEEWEEWAAWGSEVVVDGDVKIMPCLRLLKISQCEKLQSLPSYLFQTTTLEKLEVHSSHTITQLLADNMQKERPSVSGTPRFHATIVS